MEEATVGEMQIDEEDLAATIVRLSHEVAEEQERIRRLEAEKKQLCEADDEDLDVVRLGELDEELEAANEALEAKQQLLAAAEAERERLVEEARRAHEAAQEAARLAAEKAQKQEELDAKQAELSMHIQTYKDSAATKEQKRDALSRAKPLQQEIRDLKTFLGVQ